MKVEDCLGESDRDILCDFEANTVVCLRKVILIVYDARTVVSDLFELGSLAFLGLHLLGWRFGLWIDRLFRMEESKANSAFPCRLHSCKRSTFRRCCLL